jgi:hypothetical protein
MNKRKLLSAAGISLLALTSSYAATITQVANDTASTAWSTKSAPWGGAPAAGNNYVTKAGFVTAADDGLGVLISGLIRDTGSVFPGDSITIVSSTELLMKGANATTTTGNIILNGGGIRYGPNGTNPGFTTALAGSLNITSLGGVIGLGGNNTMNINSTLTGSGILSLRAAIGATANNTIDFAGDLSGFTGTLELGFTPLTTGNGGNVTLEFNQAYNLNASIVMGEYSSLDNLSLNYALTVNSFEFGATSLAAGTYTAGQLDSLVGNGSQFTGIGSLTVVPEPSAAVLLGSFGTLILVLRRRASRRAV